MTRSGEGAPPLPGKMSSSADSGQLALSFTPYGFKRFQAVSSGFMRSGRAVRSMGEGQGGNVQLGGCLEECLEYGTVLGKVVRRCLEGCLERCLERGLGGAWRGAWNGAWTGGWRGGRTVLGGLLGGVVGRWSDGWLAGWLDGAWTAGCGAPASPTVRRPLSLNGSAK